MVIETNRLRVVPLDEAALKSLIDDVNTFENEYNVRYDAEPIVGAFRDILVSQLRKMESDSDNWFYYTFWMIEFGGVIVGSIDYKNVPVDGVVEIGYGLGTKYENNGYMTETVKAFCKFAKLLGIEKIVAETELRNVKSQNVLKNAGFAVEKKDKSIWWSKKI